ncbi:MAG: thioesterase family protein [Firmicutes bacterium]|nr:thioesterase family protein [Bacillota bacterium]
MAERICRTELRVRYHETDPMRIAWHGNYIGWFEIGRTDWLRERGLSYRELEDDGIFLPVLRVECAYRQSARYDDLIVVQTTLAQYNGLRLSFSYEVLRAEDGRLLTTGLTEHTFTRANLQPLRPERQLPHVHALLVEAVAK